MSMRLLIEMALGLIILGPPAVAFFAAQQIIARQSSAPESASTAQRSPPADQPDSESGQKSVSGVVASHAATTQEAQPTPATPEGGAQTGPAENPLAPTTSSHAAL
jgi:hypothetical protein